MRLSGDSPSKSNRRSDPTSALRAASWMGEGGSSSESEVMSWSAIAATALNSTLLLCCRPVVLTLQRFECRFCCLRVAAASTRALARARPLCFSRATPLCALCDLRLAGGCPRPARVLTVHIQHSRRSTSNRKIDCPRVRFPAERRILLASSHEESWYQYHV